MKNAITTARKLIRASQLRADDDPYVFGYDCGLKGANTYNCHFSIFSSRERTKEWERGKRDGERARTTAVRTSLPDNSPAKSS